MVEVYQRENGDKRNDTKSDSIYKSIYRYRQNKKESTTNGYSVTVDKTARRFDFAINTGKQLYLIETNYYGGGGSKLKATAGEYKTLYDIATKDGHTFIWVTDGKGWLTANRPLEETFYHNEYILNLNMLENGMLDDIVK